MKLLCGNLNEISGAAEKGCTAVAGAVTCGYCGGTCSKQRITGWSDSQLKTHLHRLEELEYLALHRGAPGQSFVYALNFEMDESGRPVLPGLSYGAKREGNRSGSADGVSGVDGQRSGSSLGQVWGVSGGSAREESPVMAQVPGTIAAQNGKHRSEAGADHYVATSAAVAASRPNGHAVYAEVK